MSNITFADIVHQSISFNRNNPAHELALKLIDTRWVQRLRDISQTANTRLVYMFSEHSRFGHCLGVAHLASLLTEKLAVHHKREIETYQAAVIAAALLHDLGHLAPGSHTAYKTWFPDKADEHEFIACTIIEKDPEISSILASFDKNLPRKVSAILREDESLPPWTWEIISGGGWNVDRGNWCIVDSIMAGVSYGRYNIPALTDSIVLTDDKHLAVNESRLDAMMHFALSRHAMYRQMYQHRVLLAADMLNKAIVYRARELLGDGQPLFADEPMHAVLSADSPFDLSLGHIFQMRESWWKYHLAQWANGSDAILADLSSRLRDRRLFKTVRISATQNRKNEMEQARKAVIKAGFDPAYYLHEISTQDVHAGDEHHSMLVTLDDGSIQQLSKAEPLYQAMLRESKATKKAWLALPAEAKKILGRTR